MFLETTMSTSANQRRGTEPFNLRLPPAVRSELDRMALERSTTAAEVMRALLAAWMHNPSIVQVGFPVTSEVQQ